MNMENKKYADMVEYLKENVDTLDELCTECNCYDGSLDDYIWYNHDEDFYETYFSKKDDVARAIYYGGNYNYNDPYVRFNGYGNLETCCEFERNQDLIDGVETILDRWLDMYGDNDVDCYDNEFKELVRCFYDEDGDDE